MSATWGALSVPALCSSVTALTQALILSASLPNLLSFLKRQPPWKAGGGWEPRGCVYPSTRGQPERQRPAQHTALASEQFSTRTASRGSCPTSGPHWLRLANEIFPGAGSWGWGWVEWALPLHPAGSPPLWAELAAQVWCGLLPSHLPYAPSLGHHRDIIKLLLRGSWNSAAESSKKGKLDGEGASLDWMACSWLEQRGSQGRSPSITQKMLPSLQPKARQNGETVVQRSLGFLECLSPVLIDPPGFCRWLKEICTSTVLNYRSITEKKI